MCGRWIQIWIYQYSGQAAPSRVCLITHSSLGEWSHLLTNDQLRKARGQRDRRPSSFGWGRDERRKKRREKKTDLSSLSPSSGISVPCVVEGGDVPSSWECHTRARATDTPCIEFGICQPACWARAVYRKLKQYTRQPEDDEWTTVWMPEYFRGSIFSLTWISKYIFIFISQRCDCYIAASPHKHPCSGIVFCPPCMVWGFHLVYPLLG